MVRYSKLPFRHLVSLYDVHITHTPMILAREFSRSSIARSADFSSSHHERGLFLLRPKGGKQPTLVRGALVAQFAATEPRHLADAAELISPWVDGIDLNCGCPQPWAYTEHIGSWLLRKPEVVYDLVRATKDRLGWNFSVSIKIRVDEPKQTERLIQTAIRAGVDYVTVHGRTRHQASTAPVNLPTIRFAVDAAKGEVPIVANGDAWSMEDVLRIRTETVAQGVMSARGLLANPALFAGYRSTPAEAITRFVEIATSYGGLPFALFHRHIACMLEERLGRAEKTYFNSLTSHAGVLDYLEGRGLSLPK
ncbi:FMN-linked oxidoreductase [Dacryopinax primogenitus]|uniref:tRNA-dihydrouridine synthase n=1 Tax=Dacryopinax primogenitus (strain DJM 731) TaxID=1858805 RepID=M5FQW8_DACPD|nr:FMN-linked oxidoreductase [Dacryopinax primogenitus]EJT97179.1 FMN-linked oxidoreductase [Dacryopinax primogenitus]